MNGEIQQVTQLAIVSIEKRQTVEDVLNLLRSSSTTTSSLLPSKINNVSIYVKIVRLSENNAFILRNTMLSYMKWFVKSLMETVFYYIDIIYSVKNQLI